MLEDGLKNSPGGASDPFDSRNYVADHILGAAVVDCPPAVNLNDKLTHNQGRSYHCTAYSLTHCVEIMKTLEHSMQAQSDPEEQWANQVYDNKNGTCSEGVGDTLLHALQIFVKYGLNNKQPQIQTDKYLGLGYAMVGNDIDSMRKRLAQGYPLYTGSGDHCFCLVGYSDERKAFLAKNSYGENWPEKGGNGIWEIGYGEVDKLFTKYIIYTKKEVPMIFKDVSENSPMADAIKWGLDKKLILGYGAGDDPKERLFKPDQPLTRAEFLTILQRYDNQK